MPELINTTSYIYNIRIYQAVGLNDHSPAAKPRGCRFTPHFQAVGLDEADLKTAHKERFEPGQAHQVETLNLWARYQMGLVQTYSLRIRAIHNPEALPQAVIVEAYSLGNPG